jgi:hypothetical protein
MPATPTARSASIAAAVSSIDWMRPIAFCTTGSRSCTPTLTRFTPRKRNASRCGPVSRRGSTSTAISAPYRTSKRAASRLPIRVMSAADSVVGVPPPQGMCVTARRDPRRSATRSISVASASAKSATGA